MAECEGGLIVPHESGDAEVRVGGFALEKGPLVTLKDCDDRQIPRDGVRPGFEDLHAEAK